MYITDMLYIFLQRGINKGLSYLIYIEWLLHFAHMCVRNVEVTLCALMFVSTESTQTLISCKCWNVNGGCVHAFVCFCFASVCAHVRGRMCMCVCVCVCACLGLSNCPRAWQHSCNNYNNKTWCVCVWQLHPKHFLQLETGLGEREPERASSGSSPASSVRSEEINIQCLPFRMLLVYPCPAFCYVKEFKFNHLTRPPGTGPLSTFLYRRLFLRCYQNSLNARIV